jgi:hypothetical protein
VLRGEGEMTTADGNHLLRAAMAAVRDCADRMDERAASLHEALPKVPMDEELRATALALIAGLRDASSRVVFELALLQTQLSEGKADTATVARALPNMDATMMDVVAPLADIADRLESAAERDEKYERAFVLVIEAAAILLKGLEKARAATQAVDARRTA